MVNKASGSTGWCTRDEKVTPRIIISYRNKKREGETRKGVFSTLEGRNSVKHREKKEKKNEPTFFSCYLTVGDPTSWSFSPGRLLLLQIRFETGNFSKLSWQKKIVSTILNKKLLRVEKKKQWSRYRWGQQSSPKKLHRPSFFVWKKNGKKVSALYSHLVDRWWTRIRSETGTLFFFFAWYDRLWFLHWPMGDNKKKKILWLTSFFSCVRCESSQKQDYWIVVFGDNAITLEPTTTITKDLRPNKT